MSETHLYWINKIQANIINLHEQLDFAISAIPEDVAKIKAYRIAIEELKRLLRDE